MLAAFGDKYESIGLGYLCVAYSGTEKLILSIHVL